MACKHIRRITGHCVKVSKYVSYSKVLCVLLFGEHVFVVYICKIQHLPIIELRKIWKLYNFTTAKCERYRTFKLQIIKCFRTFKQIRANIVYFTFSLGLLYKFQRIVHIILLEQEVIELYKI